MDGNDGQVDMEALRTSLQAQARRLVGNTDEAEDLVQECLELLITRGDTIQNPSSVISWCRTVLLNLFRQRLRRRWYTEVLGLARLPEDSFDPWPAVDMRLMVQRALRELPARQRRTLHSFYLFGHSIIRIAQSENRPEGTIKRWLHEGRENLRMLLSEYPEGAPLARIYGSNWLADAQNNVVKAVGRAGYRPALSDLAEGETLPTDAALFVFGEQVGCRTGLELLLAVRGTEEIAAIPVLLLGPGRETAILAAWQAGADAYLTDPSSPDMADILTKLRTASGSEDGGTCNT